MKHPEQILEAQKTYFFIKRVLSFALFFSISSMKGTKSSGNAGIQQSHSSLQKPVTKMKPLEKYLRYQKKVTFTLPGTDPTKHENIGLGWFLEYKKRKGGREDKLDPYLRIAAVTSKGLYFQRINNSWIDIKGLSRIETQILVNTTHLNRITASHMVNNESVVTIGYQNLTLEVFDLERTKNGVPHLLATFDLSHVQAEEDDRIRSIAMVPYTNQLLVSGNRFSLFKLERRTGSIIKKVKNPVDHIRHLCAPVPTDTPNRDPQNPFRIKAKTISKTVHEMSETTSLVGTGAFGWMNFLMDWTTMKVVRYWTVERSQGGLNSDRNFIINRMIYYGGAPEAQLYIYSKSYYSTNLNWYSAIHQMIVGDTKLTHKALDNRMRWVNCTTFLYIIQKQIEGRGDREMKSYFLNIGPYSFDIVNSVIDTHKNEYAFEKLTMVTFDLDLGKKTTDWDGPFNKLDRLYLSFYFDMSVVILDVPLFNWDHCKEWRFKPLERGFRMFYGRVRTCTACAHGLAFQSTNDFLIDHALGNPVIMCEAAKKCPRG